MSSEDLSEEACIANALMEQHAKDMAVMAFNHANREMRVTILSTLVIFCAGIILGTWASEAPWWMASGMAAFAMATLILLQHRIKVSLARRHLRELKDMKESYDKILKEYDR